MSNMAASSNLLCLGIYFGIFLFENADSLLTSKLHVPYTLVPGSDVIHISSLGKTPYLVKENNDSALFCLNSEGELKTNSAINHLRGKTVDLRIKSDELSSNEDHLYIFIDSKKFSFTQHKYFATIKENSPRHTKLDILGDLNFICDSHVSFKVITGDIGKFYLQKIRNNAVCGVKILSNGPLDREDKESYTFSIQAKSKDDRLAQAIVFIHVQDENDEIPKFDQSIYSINAKSDISIGSTILTVHATDRDIGSISYSIEGTHDFTINSMSGEIFLVSNVVPVSDQVFKVIATDQGGLKSSSKVNVNIISGDLKFEPHHHLSKRAVNRIERTFETYENEGKNKPLFSVASQIQSVAGIEQYQIVQSSVNLFQVDTRGNVFVKEDANLDYEEMDHRLISMTFNITNSNIPTDYTLYKATLTVKDVNDEKPRFINQPRPFLATVSTNPSIGELVYELLADDPDTGSSITYILESAGEGKFAIENIIAEGRHVGRIVTTMTGNGQYERGREFSLVVSAQDMSAPPSAIQKSNFEIVQVLVGWRPPQFFNNPYTGYVMENNQAGYKLVDVDGSPLSIKAKPFQSKTVDEQTDYDGTIRFTLVDEKNQTSTLFHMTNQGEVTTLQSMDYEASSAHQFTLTMRAVEESTGLSSSTQLIVHLLDVNDNNPSFELSTYTNTTSEGTPVNTTLFSVTATDRDSGDNARLTYSVSDDHFYVVTKQDALGRYIGDIRVAKRLDYDRRTDHLYKFNVTATDAGPHKKSGLANIVIYVTNINDEAPEFSVRKEDIHTFVREDQNAGSYVKTIQAIDPDGDNVEYYFSDKLTVAPNGPFRIDTRSGLITLTNIIPAHIQSYTLNITAYDDGSCCGGSPKLRSDSYLVVEIKDINNNNPKFPDCNYAPHIMENMPPGAFVTKVRAEDDDRGNNGKIKYYVVTPAGKTQSFDVDPDNGTVTSKIVFDRESEQGIRGYPLTIMAEDQGEEQGTDRKLNSLCTFWVTIDDRNDNPPKFDSSVYTPTIVRSLGVNKVVATVLATDQDMGINAEVTYSLLENPGDHFRMDADTGTIFLDKSLSDFFDNNIRLQVRAEDKGTPSLHSTVLVNIDVTTGDQPAPTWDEDYNGQVYIVNETEQVGFKIATFYASSNVPPPLDGVSFAIVDSDGQPRQTSGNFRVESRNNYMNLRLNGPLNYRINNTYSLRLRVTNQGLTPLSREMRVTINVRDMNNEEPQFEGLDPKLSNSFQGSVPENEPTGVSVFTVKAVDPDADPPNNLVYYSLVPDKNDAYLKFRINSQTGLITTNTTFDREEMKVYYITVMAKDGTNSDVPYHEPPNSPNSAQALVRVLIGDKNDNPPVFEKPYYETNVLEQPPDSSKSLIRVHATDKDDADTLTYSITSGNTDGVFSIRGKTGDIYVARDLDYETMTHTFTLTITVSDSFYTNTTSVVLHVQDVNDNPPEFTKSEYVITDVVEEATPPPDGRFLVQVSATDKDTARETDFVYSISSDDNRPNNPTFSIEPKTGKIYLLKALDRDLPMGRAEYQFNVLVVDEPNSAQSLIGYAYVKVKPIDINDNKPVFTASLYGTVPENSAKGKNVMTVRADDADFGRNGTVRYMIGNNRPVDPETSMSLFLIDSETGLITSNTNKLDRETLDRYHLPIIAYDNGINPQSSTATVTIEVTDENDERPKFLQKIYKVNLLESQTSGPVISVVATDDDVDDNAALTYSIITQNDLNFFSITTLPSNVGVLTVYNPVDYEDPNQRFFNLTVKARDANPNHYDIAHVEIRVIDANDERPEFLKKVDVIYKDENIPENSLLYTFTAHDKDRPPNNEFMFSIADHADRFYVEQHSENCLVKIQNGLDGQTLDRETSEKYTVKILAIDKGIPPQTGVATLYIHVTDLNDEAPIFARPYHPVVMEDEDPSLEPIITFSAVDRDTRKFGPPFKFELPPCNENPTCYDNNNLMFSLEFDQSGDGGNGTGKVYALRKFFREEQKFYYLPIIMKDMGGHNALSQTGTSTLTIEIGDKNNNQHYDGFKEIFVYNYKGLFGDVVIGRANANDLDDWDHKDKKYFFSGPQRMKQFFSVNEDSGMITMLKGVPGGVFKFKVNVWDYVVFSRKNATSTITVTVKEISDDAVFSSGSVRFKGITSEQFVEKPVYQDPSGITKHGASSYEKFQQKLAEKLDVPVENVDIFSVMENKSTGYLDVRYAAHGSPWYPASKLDGIVTQYKSEFEMISGGQIAMVNIDECLKELCDSGGCSNILYVDEQAPVMINTKGKSFVGVGTKIVAECQCLAKNFTKPLRCTSDYCLNGGACFQDDFGDLSCSCLSGFNGQRCQQTHHSFSGGYTVYPPLAQCEASTTSIEFITVEKHGLLFYNGPVDKLAVDQPKDFISLELKGGYPLLYINHGTGTVKLQLDGKGKDGITRMKKLNDGSWHRIDIRRKGQEVTMIVDHCSAATTESTSHPDRKSCEVTGKTLGRNKYLNVNTVLQMGGRYSVPDYPTSITDYRFKGCIRNFYHNGELYDLHTSKKHPGINHQNGCSREDAVCGFTSVGGSRCGLHGTCEMVNWEQNEVQCVCKPGYRQAMKDSVKCEVETTIRDFQSSAFMAWSLKDEFLATLRKQHVTIQLQFRTRDQDGGILFHLPSLGNEYITLEIVNNHLQATYDLGNHDSTGANVISLPDAIANNGQWHTVTLTRSGQWMQLKMDSGEGRFFNELFGNENDGKDFYLRKNRLVAGSRVIWEGESIAKYDGRGLPDTCITDIRVDNKWFPMKMEESGDSPAAIMTMISNVKTGCFRNDCKNVTCASPRLNKIGKVCYPLWGTHECRCPYSTMPASSIDCEEIKYCSGINPCYSGGVCIELPYPLTFRCKCPPGWSGRLCNQQAVTKIAQGGVTIELLVIIFVSIFAVLFIALLSFLLITRCTKREDGKSILYDDQYDDIRENVIDHDEEGAGEEDQDVYDVSRLRRTDMPYADQGYQLLPNGKGLIPDGVESFISDRLDKADDNGLPKDNVMEFAYEGGDSDVGSLSSLNTESSDRDQDYNYLEDWGPKFSKLANMYGGGEDDL